MVPADSIGIRTAVAFVFWGKRPRTIDRYLGQEDHDQDGANFLIFKSAPRVRWSEILELHISADQIVFVRQHADDLLIDIASDHADGMTFRRAMSAMDDPDVPTVITSIPRSVHRRGPPGSMTGVFGRPLFPDDPSRANPFGELSGSADRNGPARNLSVFGWRRPIKLLRHACFGGR